MNVSLLYINCYILNIVIIIKYEYVKKNIRIFMLYLNYLSVFYSWNSLMMCYDRCYHRTEVFNVFKIFLNFNIFYYYFLQQ